MPKWLDLSAYKAKLVGMEFPDGKKRLVIMGLPPGGPLWNLSISKLGFRPAKSNRTLVRDDVNITPKEFRQVFMLCRVKDMPREEIIFSVAPTEAQKKNRTDDLDLRTTQYLGLNLYGGQVFEGQAGRFVRNTDNVVTENDAENPAVFLRTDGSPTALAQCADGFVNEMVRGKKMQAADLHQFVETIAWPEAPNPTMWPRTVQEAIEAAIQRRIAVRFEAFSTTPFEKHFRFAVALYERQPKFSYRTSESVIYQQYSTPVPLSLLCQRLLGDTSGKTVLEPTIGNGSMVMALPAGSEIYATEIDAKRVEQANLLRSDILLTEGDATQFDFKALVADGFDCVIANPPFGGLGSPQMIDKLRVTRIDHQIMMRSLQARKDAGLAVYVIGADHDTIYPGKGGLISGGSKNLFNWLADHYQIEDAFELNGKLYEKQGSTYPVRVVTVGAKRAPEEAAKARDEKTYRIEKLPVLNSWDEAFEHVEAVHNRISHQAAAPAPEENNEIPLDNEQEEVHDSTQLRVDENEAKSEENLIENAFQAPYIPLSTVGEANSMVPRNLLGPSQVSLANLAAHIRVPVEDYVVDKLNTPGIDHDHLAAVFSPEQIDAIALGIKKIEAGEGFLVGDMTGLGKGRILAAISLYALNSQGREIVFLTDKPNLFSDFWRDIIDICGDRVDPLGLFKPFILNSGVDIRDPKNNRIFKPSTPAERAKVLEYDGPAKPLAANGYNIMFGTYSQFNREIAKSKKSAWLPRVADGNILILDESHNAAGSSNTAANIAAALDHAWGSCYSSATSIKTADQMLAYKKAFPAGVCNESLPETLLAGGEPLQEIISSMLVEDGSLVRREHDLSRLAFDTYHDEQHVFRNEMMSDQLSNILLTMSHLSGDVNSMCAEKNKEFQKMLKELPEDMRKGQRMSVSSVNFGSRLYTILRQFLLAVSVDAAVGRSVQHLKEGRKPVIVIEQTMESLLQETLANSMAMDDEEINDNTSLNGLKIPTLTFRDLLDRMLSKIGVVVERNDYGSVERRSISSYAKSKEQAEALEKIIDHIRKQISAFPDLPLSPLDTMRDSMEKAGFSCGEISGRSLMVKPQGDEMSVSLRTDDRLKTIYDFNNGGLDAVILTRAGSTGLSLHASRQFADQRQRVLIELQIPNNVAERIQFFGRVNRKGQISEPLIETISTGLPGQIRILAMQNAKLRKLSANTQSNRENAVEMTDVPDILNNVGNKICYTFLENNPEVARLLDIDIDPDETTDIVDDAHFANKLTGRIALLPIAEQKRIYNEISAEYVSFLKEAEAQGVNPFKTKEYDLKARVVGRQVFEGVELPKYNSVFDKPVYVSTIEWDEVVAPVRFSKLQEMMEYGRYRLMGDVRIIKTTNQRRPLNAEPLAEIIHEAFIARRTETLEALKDKFSSLSDALESKEPNSIKNIEFRRKWMINAAHDVLIGNILETMIAGETQTGVVVEVKYPPSGKEHLPGQYEVRIQRPGVEHADLLTFNMLMTNGYEKKSHLDMTYNTMEDVFNQAPSGKITMQRAILDGNLFKAAQLAAMSGMGRAAVFTDENGVRHRAVMLPGGVKQDLLMTTKPRITDSQIAASLLLKNRNLSLVTDPDMGSKKAVHIMRSGSSDYAIRCDGTKAFGGKYFTDEKLVELTGGFAGSRSVMRAEFDMSILPDVLARLEQMGCVFFAPTEYRNEIQALSAQQAENQTPKNEDVKKPGNQVRCAA